MNVDCTKCGKKYEVDDERVRGVKFKFQCHECNASVQGTGPKIFDDSMQVEENSFSGDQAAEMDHAGHMGGAGVHWKNSIQAKLSAILIMVTVGILVAYTVFNFYSTQKRMTAELTHLAEITAFRLSKSLIVPLWEVDEEQVLENIKSEMLEKRIFSIVVKDNDLKTIFQGGRRDLNWNVIQTKDPVTETFISKTKEITRGDEIVGSVETNVSDKFMRDESIRSTLNIIIAVIILIISILLTIFIVMRKLLINPISKLTAATEQISLGSKNVEIGIQSEDEMGHLADAIKRMQNSLLIAMRGYRSNR
ncbi:MAG: HAMP domain-containing protein [Desulfobulbaceae bacterium]|nr:HAMP domain-containing protein [Desulfobulbaceae bacterium]